MDMKKHGVHPLKLDCKPAAARGVGGAHRHSRRSRCTDVYSSTGESRGDGWHPAPMNFMQCEARSMRDVYGTVYLNSVLQSVASPAVLDASCQVSSSVNLLGGSAFTTHVVEVAFRPGQYLTLSDRPDQWISRPLWSSGSPATSSEILDFAEDGRQVLAPLLRERLLKTPSISAVAM
eukprot:6484085-Amphidinium_carterae.4